MKKLILPGERQFECMPRERLIGEFLKEWLTPKQLQGMGPWWTEMLDAFMTDVLLQAQKVGIEKLLLHHAGGNNLEGLLKESRQRVDKLRLPLAIISKPLKPKISQVKLEEVPGGLTSETKSVLLADISTNAINTLDVVDHVK